MKIRGEFVYTPSFKKFEGRDMGRGTKERSSSWKFSIAIVQWGRGPDEDLTWT